MNKNILKLILPVIIFFMATSSAKAATTYYVSPSGNDNYCNGKSTANYPGSGSGLNCAFKTIQKSANTMTAGDTVQVMSGTYRERVIPANSGSSTGGYITYQAYPGASVILDGTGIALSNPQGLIDIVYKDYIKVQDFTIKNSTWNGISIRGTSPDKASYIEISNMNVDFTYEVGIFFHYANHGIAKYNKVTNVTRSSGISFWWSDQMIADHNTIINAHLNDQAHGGHEESLSVAGTSNFEVSNNDISMTGGTHGTYTGHGYLGNEAIDVKENSSWGKVHHNYIHGFYDEGGGIYLDAWRAISPSLHDIDIYNNFIKNNSGGITVGSEQGGTTENVNIYNNVVTDIGANGISVAYHISDTGIEGLKRNVKIYNNTIYKAKWNGGGGIYITANNIENIVIRNNVVYFNNTNSDISVASSSRLPNVSADHNYAYHVSSTGSSTDPSCSLAYPNCIELTRCRDTGYRYYGTATCINYTLNYRGDPKFVSLTTPDLHLQSTSPAKDTGVDLKPLVSNDYDGKTRPIGTAFDMGAYEYGGTTTPSPGITATPTIRSTNTPTSRPTNTPTPVATAVPQPGDANGDGGVDLLDYVIWLGHYSQTTANGARDGDFNGDARVDLLDYIIWLNNF